MRAPPELGQMPNVRAQRTCRRLNRSTIDGNRSTGVGIETAAAWGGGLGGTMGYGFDQERGADEECMRELYALWRIPHGRRYQTSCSNVLLSCG